LVGESKWLASKGIVWPNRVIPVFANQKHIQKPWTMQATQYLGPLWAQAPTSCIFKVQRDRGSKSKWSHAAFAETKTKLY
jgi:hypothetical protein